MAKEIPTGSKRAKMQLHSRQLDSPVIKVNFRLPRDAGEVEAILDAWHSRTMNKEDARFTISEVIQDKDTDLSGTLIPKITKQYSIDLHSILFIETHYYDDEPDKED